MDTSSKERRLNRLKDYDYSQIGYYFVTICTKNKIEHFGKIENGKTILNRYGEITQRYWKGIPNNYKNVRIDEFIIMPNHIHGIIIIKENYDNVVRTEQCSVPTDNTNKMSKRKNYGHLSKIVKSFKDIVTKVIREQFNDFGFQWQRSYYDHIIRNETSLAKIREYIVNNPLKWDLDKDNIENLFM